MLRSQKIVFLSIILIAAMAFPLLAAEQSDVGVAGSWITASGILMIGWAVR